MLKIFILRRISRSSVNSYTIFKEFSARKSFVRVSRTTGDMKNEIYNAIKSLEKSGYIKSSQKIENGRLKNYYGLAPKGSKVLKASGRIFRRHLRELAAIMKK